MIGALPKTTFESLHTRSISALRCGVDDVGLKRLRSEAQKLANADSFGSMEVKAVVAALDDDWSEAAGLYDRVLSATGFAVDRLMRYMILLVHGGESIKAFDVYTKHLHLEKLPPQAREDVAQILGYAGWAVESTKIRADLLNGGYDLQQVDAEGIEYAPAAIESHDRTESFECSSQIRSLRMTVDALEAIGLEDAWVAQRVGTLLKFFRARREAVKGVRSMPVPTEEGKQGLMINLYIEETPEKAAETEWEMFGHLAAIHPDVLDAEGVSFALVAAKAEGVHAN